MADERKEHQKKSYFYDVLFGRKAKKGAEKTEEAEEAEEAEAADDAAEAVEAEDAADGAEEEGGLEAWQKKMQFKACLRTVLRQVHPDSSITANSVVIINNLILEVILELTSRAGSRKDVQEVLPDHLRDPILQIMPGEVAKHAISEFTKAITKHGYSSQAQESQKGSVVGGRHVIRFGDMESVAAGLCFPVLYTESLMTEFLAAKCEIGSAPKRPSRLAAVGMAAAMEYLTAEVLELSGNAARDSRKRRIVPWHVMLAVRSDDELDEMCRRLIAARGRRLFSDAKPLDPKMVVGPPLPEHEAEWMTERVDSFYTPIWIPPNVLRKLERQRARLQAEA